MRGISLLAIVLAAALLATPASAGPIVSATQTSKLDADGTDFDYTITLTNSSSSTSPVGTFWFSWVPGKDLMSSSPLSEITPTGWTANVTHGGATDGFGIQWVANGANSDLTPGNSLTFGFKSAEPPAELAGLSKLFPSLPESTAFVYSGGPFSDAGDQIVATPLASVPEPSSLLLTLVGGLALTSRKWIGLLTRALVSFGIIRTDPRSRPGSTGLARAMPAA
jgi:hypothetical protein